MALDYLPLVVDDQLSWSDYECGEIIVDDWPSFIPFLFTITFPPSEKNDLTLL